MPSTEQEWASNNSASVTNPLPADEARTRGTTRSCPSFQPRFPRDPVLHKQLLEAEKLSLCRRSISLGTGVTLISLWSLVPIVWTVGVSLEDLASHTFFFDGCKRKDDSSVTFETCYRCNGNSTRLSSSTVGTDHLRESILLSSISIVLLVRFTYKTLSVCAIACFRKRWMGPHARR